MRGYVRFFPPAFWQPAHQRNEFFGGSSRLGLRQRRSQFRHDFVTHHDLDFGAGIFPYLAHQLRKAFACFTDRQFHGVKCTRVYKMSQQVCRRLVDAVSDVSDMTGQKRRLRLPSCYLNVSAFREFSKRGSSLELFNLELPQGFERSAAIEPFDRTQGRLLERLERAFGFRESDLFTSKKPRSKPLNRGSDPRLVFPSPFTLRLHHNPTHASPISPECPVHAGHRALR